MKKEALDTLDINKIYEGDNLDVMVFLDDGCIDLTVTSPPYDNLRTYGGTLDWDFEGVAQELYRVTKPGGVVVWVVGDATINGSETGTSFRQALYFMSLGFNLHDTMIWDKGNFSAVGALKTRYAPVFEYMFVLCKGKLRVFNPIKDRVNATVGRIISGTTRQADGTMVPKSTKGKVIAKWGQRWNIWQQCPPRGHNEHPAVFPLTLAKDHITSWSNSNDLILDPFAGSGTTGVAAADLGRNYILIEKNPEYVPIFQQRMEAHNGRS